MPVPDLYGKWVCTLHTCMKVGLMSRSAAGLELKV